MEWRPVIGYESLYEVSERGDIRTAYGKTKRVCRTRRYPCVYLSRYGSGKTHNIHSLVASAFLGERPSGKQINHKDGNRQNNHYSNLEYVTAEENMQHAHRTGLMRLPNGSRQWRAKLTESDIPRILELCNLGIPQRVIAAEFGVVQQAISDIKCGRNWKEITVRAL